MFSSSIKIRALRFFLGLLLAGTWSGSAAAKIYRYQDAGGNWHYTDAPTTEQSLEEVNSEKAEKQPITWDLNQHLSEKLPPRNAMEKARNFTVTIKTPIGLGSGFFIDEKGFIVTNRHVFEGDKNQIEAADQAFKTEKARLGKYKRDLLAYAANLMTYEGLGGDPRLSESLKNEDLDGFFRSYKALGRKDTAFAINSQRLEGLLGEFHQRHEKLDKLKEFLQDSERHAANPPAYVTVILADNTPFEAKFIAVSADHDLALFQLSGYKTPRPEFSDVRSMPAGARVFAVGSPLGLSHSVSEGVFSALRTDDRGAWIIQSTAKVNRGNSGGPLIDEQGRILGVNTAKMMRPGVEGISFSISIDTVLETFGKVQR